MSDSKKAGIGGILDGILTTAIISPKKAASNPTIKSPKPDTPHANESEEAKRIGARRGRPLGKGRESKEPKEKVTVWLDAKLIAQYRDWSWEARSQLSTLVEDALTDYRKRRFRQESIPS
jgi:uncharacterized protein (DUF4415 family)